MKLQEAEKIASEIHGILGHHFRVLTVAGSVRRKREEVTDIDFVGIRIKESDYKFGEKSLDDAILEIDKEGAQLAKERNKHLVERFALGDKIKRFKYSDCIIDIYLANDETYETLLLIRTGSKDHNIRLTTMARGKGMKLFASGDGLWYVDGQDNPKTMVVNTEEMILFTLLGRVPKPEDRN